MDWPRMFNYRGRPLRATRSGETCGTQRNVLCTSPSGARQASMPFGQLVGLAANERVIQVSSRNPGIVTDVSLDQNRPPDVQRTAAAFCSKVGYSRPVG